MTLQEARKVLFDDKSTMNLWAQAAAKICEETPENEKLSKETLNALLRCLTRPNAGGIGIVGLYLFTKRPCPEQFGDYRDHCRDPEDWLAYLKANKFLD